MTPCPQIVTHQSAHCPKPGHEWIASLYVETFAGKKSDGTWGPSGLSRLPVSFLGATEEEARHRAEDFWAREQKREALREEAKLARVEAMRRKSA